jgi:hypothetical protein
LKPGLYFSSPIGFYAKGCMAPPFAAVARPDRRPELAGDAPVAQPPLGQSGIMIGTAGAAVARALMPPKYDGWPG